MLQYDGDDVHHSSIVLVLSPPQSSSWTLPSSSWKTSLLTAVVASLLLGGPLLFCIAGALDAEFISLGVFGATVPATEPYLPC